MNEFSERIGLLISGNKMEQAIKEMALLLKGPSNLKELIIHSARYNAVKEQIRLGVISLDDAQVKKNQIMLALLDLTDEITELTASSPQLSEEVQKTLSQIVNNSTTINQQHYGEGDNVGGDKIIYK